MIAAVDDRGRIRINNNGGPVFVIVDSVGWFTSGATPATGTPIFVPNRALYMGGFGDVCALQVIYITEQLTKIGAATSV